MNEQGDFERKRHYQLLKMACLKAALLATPGEGEEEAIGMAKRFFRLITEEPWGSGPTEERADET